jgi:methyltransferase family protein
LALAITASKVVGVDPADAPLEQSPPAGATVFRMTSDEFFSRKRVKDVFDRDSVDLIFIDGMHWYENALRDFLHAERWTARTSVIVMHDCLPVMDAVATRERKTSFWTGDTWKTLEALIQYRPDLQIEVIPTSPSGLVIIRNLDPSSSLLEEKYSEIAARYESLVYPYECGVFPPHYHQIENSDKAIRSAFADQRAARSGRR